MMNKIYFGAAAAAIAVVATAALSGANALDTFATSLHSAQGLDVSYTMTEVGGVSANYRVVLAKPNKARIDGPTTLTVADGKTITVYNKTDKVFFKKNQSDAELRAMFNDPALSTWSPFFDEKVFASVTSAKDAGERTRRGVAYKVWPNQDVRSEHVQPGPHR